MVSWTAKHTTFFQLLSLSFKISFRLRLHWFTAQARMNCPSSTSSCVLLTKVFHKLLLCIWAKACEVTCFAGCMYSVPRHKYLFSIFIFKSFGGHLKNLFLNFQDIYLRQSLLSMNETLLSQEYLYLLRYTLPKALKELSQSYFSSSTDLFINSECLY